MVKEGLGKDKDKVLLTGGKSGQGSTDREAAYKYVESKNPKRICSCANKMPPRNILAARNATVTEGKSPLRGQLNYL